MHGDDGGLGPSLDPAGSRAESPPPPKAGHILDSQSLAIVHMNVVNVEK